MPPRQQILKWLRKAIAGALGWSWAGSVSLLLLSAFSWFEFTRLKYGLWLGVTAVLLTLTGLGPHYFIIDVPLLFSRQTFHKFRLRFEKAVGLLLKAAAAYFLISFLLLFIIGWTAFLPLLAPMYAYDWWKHQDRENSHQVIFEGKWGNIQLRPARPEYGYPSPRPNTFIVRPLSPFINIVTKLPPNQPDNTWRRIRPYTPLIEQWQDTLLSESRAYKYVIPR
ncbi:hypothetical protein [Hymenobacter aerophilus]|uniref:hypothetical protein n=1 Tax=Hymenobacter aerophilus TaxID=119644 RepID=UPI0012FCB4F9|nr:hypothetical protein [Hymenobacter aerophilus]